MSHGQCALVASRQQQATLFVGYGHEDDPATAGLKVLLGGVDGGTGKLILKSIHKGGIDGFNANGPVANTHAPRSEEHTSELQSRGHLVCRLLLEKKKKTKTDGNGA